MAILLAAEAALSPYSPVDKGLMRRDNAMYESRRRSAWMEIHKDEIIADWELAVAGEEPFRIAPLQ